MNHNYDEEAEIIEEGEEAAVVNNGIALVNPADMPDLDEAEEGFNVQAEGIEFKEVGQRIRAVFNGITLFQTKDQQNPGEYVDRETAILQTKDGIRTNMGANLVKQLKMLPPGTAVQITYKGEQKSKGGRNVKVYEVKTLKVPRLNVAPVGRQIAAVSGPSREKTQFTNTNRASEYWNTVYNQFKFSEQEGKDHLALFENDFAKAIDALKGFIESDLANGG